MEDAAFPDGDTAFSEGPCAHGPKEGHKRKHALGPMPQVLESAAGEAGPSGNVAGPPSMGSAPGGAAPAGSAAV